MKISKRRINSFFPFMFVIGYNGFMFWDGFRSNVEYDPEALIILIPVALISVFAAGYSAITLSNGHGYDIDVNGITEYCPFGITHRYCWKEFQSIQIISYQDPNGFFHEKKYFFFSKELLPEEPIRQKKLVVSQQLMSPFTDVIISYTEERYAEFCRVCPNIKLQQVKFH